MKTDCVFHGKMAPVCVAYHLPLSILLLFALFLTILVTKINSQLVHEQQKLLDLPFLPSVLKALIIGNKEQGILLPWLMFLITCYVERLHALPQMPR